MKRKISLVLIIAAMLLLQACLGLGDEKEDGGHEGETASQAITAADGGTVSSPSGAASVDIPAGALAEDTTITLTSLGTEDQPDSENLGSDVYEFGPDGTEFLEPVTISLVLNGDVPEKMKAVLAVLDGETWTAVEGSTVEGEEVSGQVTHFSKYVIHFVGDDAIIESGDEVCKDLEFSACGGDVVGSWKILSYCTSQTVVGENPFAEQPSCADDLFEVDVTWLGSITYKDDGTYSNEMGMEMSIYLELTDECLTELAGDDASDLEGFCTDIGNTEGMASCVYESSLCKCTGKPNTMMMDDSPEGTYELDGNDIIIHTSEGQTQSITYCVEGTRMVAETPADDEGNVSYVVAERL